MALLKSSIGEGGFRVCTREFDRRDLSPGRGEGPHGQFDRRTESARHWLSSGLATMGTMLLGWMMIAVGITQFIFARQFL